MARGDHIRFKIPSYATDEQLEFLSEKKEEDNPKPGQPSYFAQIFMEKIEEERLGQHKLIIPLDEPLTAKEMELWANPTFKKLAANVIRSLLKGEVPQGFGTVQEVRNQPQSEEKKPKMDEKKKKQLNDLKASIRKISLGDFV